MRTRIFLKLNSYMGRMFLFQSYILKSGRLILFCIHKSDKIKLMFLIFFSFGCVIELYGMSMELQVSMAIFSSSLLPLLFHSLINISTPSSPPHFNHLFQFQKEESLTIPIIFNWQIMTQIDPNLFCPPPCYMYQLIRHFMLCTNSKITELIDSGS